ncbi:GlxA family transcriptional regulator [Mycolicibacterium vaccae]|uniref:GlxA family transcriptional regulator n=1 Tax=Mycolicibacterium vaccae TaxID=1810 RepID=UPI003D091C9E
MKTVAVLAQPGTIGFEVMTPGQVFGMANTAAEDSGGAPLYDIRICAPGRQVGTVAQWGPVQLRTDHGLEALASADIVVVPGRLDFLTPPGADVVAALKGAADGGSRIAAICVGAFTVAAAGLLDNARATTHWQWADELARRHPHVDVDASVLFVDNGRTLTSAGVGAGLDLCLHLVRSDHGPDVAAATARRLVMPAWRDGGQTQFIEQRTDAPRAHPLQETIDWMHRHADGPLDLETIAGHAAMSVRTLSRRFRDYVGTTPLELLARIRVDRARRLLETTDLRVDRVAEQAGFGSEASLRHHFGRVVGIPPQKYRSSYHPRRPDTLA